MLIYWIWLASHPALTELEKARLLECFSDPEDLFFARGAVSEDMDGLVSKARSCDDLSEAEKILEQCDRLGLRILPLSAGDYPQRLKHIQDPPMVLYVKGNLPRLDEGPVIGVVGTRKASAYGLNTAWRMGFEIAGCGGTVVSGMALGIDAMAMRGALTGGSFTLGVLGCGADQVYPKANRALFEDTARFGCILSEFAPGTPPNAWNFPRRNRIISGLSNGVLVVEAPEKSGSLITARLAAEQGRDVFVVPGNVDLAGFAGSYRLLREGAIPVSCGWDVVSEYETLYPEKVRRDDTPAPAPKQEPVKSSAKVAQNPRIPAEKGSPEKKTIDNAPAAPYIDVNKIQGLSEQERAIVQALQQGPRLVDDVIAQTGFSTGRMLSCMTILELKGIIRRKPGKYIALREPTHN